MALLVAALAVTATWRHVSNVSSRSAPVPVSSISDATQEKPPVRGLPFAPEARLTPDQVLLALKNSTGPEDSRATLAKLRAYLSTLRPEAASAIIREFLDSNYDGSTRLGLRVGSKGYLDDAPSLRVFLLDYLAQVDPAAAAYYSAQILAAKGSPDEWAVALRNYAQANASPEARNYLNLKVEEMILYQPWQTNPSTAYLESFDVVVYARDVTFVPALAQFIRQTDNPALTRAAYLALDRLVAEEPTAVLAQLLQDPDSMKGREATRANYFARADPSDPEQKLLLETYLLNPQITPAELSAFAEIYPNANYMISHNLLTQTAVPSGEAIAMRDLKALEVVETWQADPRFAQVQPQLETIKARLSYFVRQESGGK